MARIREQTRRWHRVTGFGLPPAEPVSLPWLLVLPRYLLPVRAARSSGLRQTCSDSTPGEKPHARARRDRRRRQPVRLRQRETIRRLIRRIRSARDLLRRQQQRSLRDASRIESLEGRLCEQMMDLWDLRCDAATKQAHAPQAGLPQRLRIVVPWHPPKNLAGITPSLAHWWNRVPDELIEALRQRGFLIEILTTCCRTPDDDWWENGFDVGTEMVDGLTIHRFPVRCGGRARFAELAQRIRRGDRLGDDEQRALFRHGIGSDALVAYAARQQSLAPLLIVSTAHGLSHELVQVAGRHCVLLAGPFAEPQEGWSSIAETLRGARKVVFWNTADRDDAIRRYASHTGRKLVESSVIHSASDAPRGDTALSIAPPGSPQWDTLADVLRHEVLAPCTS